MDTIRQYLDKVDVLPLSPTLLPKLLPKLSDVDANFDEVVDLIALDPSLTSKLLQICNSAYFGRELAVDSVSEAVSRVGYQAVYLLVAMINGSACFPVPSPKGVDAGQLWRHSITTAFNTKFVGESVGADGNLLFTAGLLHDLGKVILGQDPQSVGLYGGLSDTGSLAREHACFGCDHAEISGALLERSTLPSQIVVAVRHHHRPKAAHGFSRIAACICLADLLTHGQEQPAVLERQEFTDTLKSLELTPDHTVRWAERLRDQQALLNGMSRLPL